jgi:hypothetical protein
VVLFVALLAFLLLTPVAHQVREALAPDAPPLVERLVFVGVLSAADFSVSTGRGWKFFALGLGLPAALLVLAHGYVGGVSVAVLRHLVGAAFLAYVAAVVLRFIYRSGRVTVDTVCASLCVYLLLGIIWALGYSVVDLADPAAFHSAGPGGSRAPGLQPGRGEPVAALYYSFVTLTTLGYGDIVPASPVARALASVEALTGQLYLAVLVARLVGLHIVESLGQGKAPSDAPPAAAGRAGEESPADPAAPEGD